MTEQEIRDNAPDGAKYTYRGIINEVYYYKVDGDRVFFWCVDRWEFSEAITMDDLYLLKPL